MIWKSLKENDKQNQTEMRDTEDIKKVNCRKMRQKFFQIQSKEWANIVALSNALDMIP